MKISILTLFPEMFTGPFDYSIVKRAQEKGLVAIQTINIRDFASDAYKSVDDHPYGGGVGMVMRVDVIDRAINSVIPGLFTLSTTEGTRNPSSSNAGSRPVSSTGQVWLGRGRDDIHVVLLDPKGKSFTQAKARAFSKLDHLILICGHYEGVDERVRQLADESISIGDYVLTGGELPAMVITDAIVRLLPGVLKEEVTTSESFSLDIGNWKLDIPLLEYPQYTRPEAYKGMKVPDVLLSGDHKKIEQWKKDHVTAQKDHAYPRKSPASETL